MLPRLGRRRSETPALSAIVPVYDVEAWLPACLKSLRAQTFEDYEVIVVDDGSPDSSADLVSRAMRRDRRIRLVRQANGGLGAARNRGVLEARGGCLTFVDSDDELPPEAWSTLMGSLRETDSDFAVGRAERDDGTRRWTTPLMVANHASRHLRADIDTAPLMLADVFAWNKVFRREFWTEAGLSFPEGTRYEDQPVITRAFLRATSFDVLTETVYLWRVREDRSSITQKRHELADLRDRLATKRDSAAQVLAHGSASVSQTFYGRVLPVDMWEYFRAVPGASEEYWQLLVDGVRGLWNEDTVPFEVTGVPPQQRLMGWLTAAGRREDLARWLAHLDSEGPTLAEGRLVHPWDDEVTIATADPAVT